MWTFSSSPVPFQEQYELVHKAIAQLFEKQLQLLESPTNAQIHDSMVRHTCWTLWRGRKTGCRWVICAERWKTEIISHRGEKGRGKTREWAMPSENSLRRPLWSLRLKEFWFWRTVTVRPFIPIYPLFVFELGQHRRYETPLQSKEGSAGLHHNDNLKGTKVADVRQALWQRSSSSFPACGSSDDIISLP